MVNNRALLYHLAFVSNMLNPNQDTGVDAIFGQHAEATALIDIPTKNVQDNVRRTQTNKSIWPEALSVHSSPGIVTSTVANKLQQGESIDVRPTELVNEQLEFEVLVRSSKEAKTSHAVAANLSELELKKILIDKMEANNSINRSDIQRQLYKALVDAPGSKRRRSGKEPESTSAPSEKTTTIAGKTTTGSKNHKQSARQSALVEETMQSTDVFEAPAHQEFETGVYDEQAEEEVHHLPDWFQQPKRLPSPDHT
ncbi:hypothetical protein Tco_1216966 [Tanacetum coccineum]